MINAAKKIIVNDYPDWMPGEFRGLGEDLTFSFRFTANERKIFKRKKKIKPSQFAERHIYIPMAALKGKWHRDTLPYLNGIMDASFYPSVGNIFLCAAPQVGKTECVNACLMYAVDRDPGSALIVFPDQNTSKENMKDRVLGMIRKSPRLRSYLTGLSEDEAGQRINLVNMPIYGAWSHSLSRLANKPIRYLVLEETEIYPETVNKKAGSPIDEAEKRTRSYEYGNEAKIWMVSTPKLESGPIWVALTTEAQVVFDYEVVCPDCGFHQLMDFEQFRYPEGKDAETIENKKLGRYECKECKSQWTDARRNAAVKWGRWIARGDGRELFQFLEAENPKKIGFHLPAWISRFVSLSKVVSAYLKSQNNKNKERDFYNNYKAEPYTKYEVIRETEHLAVLRDDRPRFLVPGGGVVSCLTGGVDTQDNGFWYEIRAWGYGIDQESWQIREGFAETFEQIDRYIFKDEYEDEEGKIYKVRLMLQDAMGHRTKEVYEFARTRKGMMWPTRGEQKLLAQWKISDIKHWPGKKTPIDGGLQLLRFDTNFYKNALNNKLEISQADAGAWQFHNETSETWLKHMCAEFINEKGFWECPPNKPNHGWDCSVLNLVAADMLGVKSIRRPGETKKGDKQERKEKQKPPKKRRRW